MQKWEYREVIVSYRDDYVLLIELSKGVSPVGNNVPQYLDYLGSEGWEMINVLILNDKEPIRKTGYYLKRPVE